ncbi:MAG: hypothetical protein IPG85_04015 [Bacteroidetes bacterium]|nr:hypothetical protein [Bacteroidota bacterium]
MQELINKLISEVGLNAEQAQKTIETVMSFVKSKVPSALSGNIDAMFSGVQATVKNQAMLTKQKIFAEATKDKLEDFAENTKEKLEDFLQSKPKKN